MIRLHDTRARKKVEFQPREPGKVSLYVCGVTVYDLCHVGHARTAVAFDVIVRHLRARGFDVRFVRNITDVDDKIIRKGLAEGGLPPRLRAFTPTRWPPTWRVWVWHRPTSSRAPPRTFPT